MKEEAMKCKDTGELLTAYLDGEVTKEEKALVESHLADCPQCKAELEALKVTQASLRGVLTSMADEVVPSTEAWRKVRAKIEKKDGWLESLGKILSNQKWQGVAITAMVVVVAVSVTVWQISGAGSPALVAPAPAGNTAVVSTTSKAYDTPTTPTTPTAPPPAQVTVNPSTVTVPAPAPAPTPTAPTPAPITPTTPPITTAPPPAITVQSPPPAQVTVNPPAVTVQSPPPAQVTVNVPAQNPQTVNAPLWFWIMLPATLLAAVIIIFGFGRRSKV